MTDDDKTNGMRMHLDGWYGHMQDGYFVPDEPMPSSSGDYRIDRIDHIIQDTHDETIAWHNQRTSGGRPENMIAGKLVVGPGLSDIGVSMSLERNGYPRQSQSAGEAWDTRGLGVAGVLLVIALCIMTCAGMMLFDGAISFVR